MTSNLPKENFKNFEPTTLQEALNVIKFLNTSHKQEIAKWKAAYQKQTDTVKRLESNRKKELEFLSSELQKYEVNLALRTDSVTKQLAQKDDIIHEQLLMIEELNKKLKIQDELPEISVSAAVDSNSDSGVNMENDETVKPETSDRKEGKTMRKCSRRFADSISFLRRVDFSPIKYKPCNRETKKKEEKKNNLEVPFDKRFLNRQFSDERPMSDDDRRMSGDFSSHEHLEPVALRPKKNNDSMSNHFSDDGSEDTSEELFDRVMTRSSIRRSVKANPKYKKINRTKSKLLEQVKVNIID